jgi:hypothetical protein
MVEGSGAVSALVTKGSGCSSGRPENILILLLGTVQDLALSLAWLIF